MHIIWSFKAKRECGEPRFIKSQQRPEVEPDMMSCFEAVIVDCEGTLSE
jgi:hypothetical protein